MVTDSRFFGLAMAAFSAGTLVLSLSEVRAAGSPDGIGDISWNLATAQHKAKGCDLWQTTWAADGSLRTGWGDCVGPPPAPSAKLGTMHAKIVGSAASHTVSSIDTGKSARTTATGPLASTRSASGIRDGSRRAFSMSTGSYGRGRLEAETTAAPGRASKVPPTMTPPIRRLHGLIGRCRRWVTPHLFNTAKPTQVVQSITCMRLFRCRAQAKSARIVWPECPILASSAASGAV